MTVQTTTTTGHPPAPARNRLAYIDNLRIALTVLVVIHHAAVTYGNLPVFYYYEAAKDGSGLALDVLVVFNQTFFMGFFFMLSGYFVPASFDRKGARTFFKDRLVRLGIPVLLFAVLMRPAVTLWFYRTDYQELPYWLYYLVSWDPGVMWFAEVLLVFCLGYLLIRRWRRAAEPISVPADPTARPGYTGRLPGPLTIAGFGAALTVVTFGWRQLVSTDAHWPVVGLPTPGYLPQYLGLFVVGVYAYRRGWFARVPRAALWWSGAATIGFGIARLATLMMILDGQTLAEQAAFTIAECGFAVSVILFLLTLFQRVANRQNAASKFLADNAYGVYFWHTLVLILVSMFVLRGWDAPAIAKFAVLTVIALPLTWGLAGVLRRIPAVRKIF